MEAEEIEGVDAAGAGATIARVVLGVKVFRFCMMLSKSLGKSPKRFDCSVLLTYFSHYKLYYITGCHCLSRVSSPQPKNYNDEHVKPSSYRCG
jgi:hypothetical protein